jgi:hypothetical protein
VERALAGRDTGIPDFCRPKYTSVVEVWILPQDMPIGHDGSNQRSYEKGYQVFLRLYGTDELKNEPKGAIWLHLLSAIIH